MSSTRNNLGQPDIVRLGDSAVCFYFPPPNKEPGVFSLAPGGFSLTREDAMRLAMKILRAVNGDRPLGAFYGVAFAALGENHWITRATRAAIEEPWRDIPPEQ